MKGGASDGEDEELQEIHSPTDDSNKLEDQPVGSDIEEEEKSTGENECPTDGESPTTYTTTASGQVSKPPACLIEDIGELHCLQQNEIINLFLVNCWKKTSMVVLVQGLEVA